MGTTWFIIGFVLLGPAIWLMCTVWWGFWKRYRTETFILTTLILGLLALTVGCIIKINEETTQWLAL